MLGHLHAQESRLQRRHEKRAPRPTSTVAAIWLPLKPEILGLHRRHRFAPADASRLQAQAATCSG